MAHQTSSVQVVPRLYLSNLNNDILEEITEYVSGGSVTFDAQRLIPMSLKLRMDHDLNVIAPFADYVAPFLTVRYDNGEEVTSQMGLFNTQPSSKNYNQNSHSQEFIGHDMTWRLSVDIFDLGYSVSVGANIITAIETICTDAGITRTSFTPTDYTATIAYSWKPATPKIEVINDLLASIGYVPLFATKDGYLASHPYVSMNNRAVATTYDTTSNENNVRIIKNVQAQPQFDRTVNKVTVVRQGPNQATIALTRRNNNPASPTSIQSLGVTIAKVVNDSKVIDHASARLLAIRTLEEGSRTYERYKITTTPDVERAPHEIYHVKLMSAEGAVITDNKFYCTEWTIGLTPQDGLMTHTIARIDNGPLELESSWST